MDDVQLETYGFNSAEYPENALFLVWFRLSTFSLDMVAINLSIYKICSKDELVIAISGVS